MGQSTKSQSGCSQKFSIIGKWFLPVSLYLACFLAGSQAFPKPEPQEHDRSYAIATGAPLITPINDEIQLEPNSDYTLSCESNEPITWILPTDFISYEIKEATHGDRNRRYGLELHLDSISHLNVGYYYCVKNSSLTQDWRKWDNSEFVELVNTDRASSIYVFVNDTQNLLAEISTPIFSVHQFSDLTIPCKPTMPDIPVILTGANREYYSDQTLRYDPKLGFVINMRAITDGGDYKCLPKIPSLDNEEEEQYLTVKIMGNDYINTQTDFIQRPEIKSETRGHAILGSTFSLTCNVTVQDGVVFDMTWTYPAKGPDRVDIQKSVKLPGSEPNRVIGQTSITIRNASEEDDGRYSCTAKDHANNMSKSVYNIKVLNDTASYIEMNEPANYYNIGVNANNTAQMSVRYKGYPFPSITWYKPNGEEIFNSVKYSIKTEEDKSFLAIYNVSYADCGSIIVKAKNEKHEKILKFNLEVDDIPHVEMQSIYVQQNQEAHLECNVRSCKPTIATFTFIPCSLRPRWPNCDKTRDQLFNNTKTGRKGSKPCEYIYDLYFTPDSPGKATCYAASTSGNNRGVAHVIVGDIAGNMSITGIEDNHNIARGDTVELICQALAYYFTDDLNWYRDYELIQPSENIEIETNITDFSYQKILRFKEIKDSDRGQYECKGAFIHDKEKYESQFFDLFIHEPVWPKMIETDLDVGPKIKRKFGDSLELQCKADGLPLPQVEWYKDDELLEPTDKVQIDQLNSKLVIPLLNLENEGVYKCVVSNRLGVIDKTFEVILTNVPGGFNKQWLWLIAVVFVLLLVLVIYLFIRSKKERKALKELKSAGLAYFQAGAMEHYNPALSLEEQADLLPYDPNYEFPREKLKLGKQVGAGAFGVVLKGTAEGIKPDEKETPVAVKMVKRTADSEVVRALVSELKIMQNLGQHLNVVNLLGAVTKNIAKRELLVIVEYCCYGNVQNVLLKNRKRFINQINPETNRIDPSIMTQRFSDNFELNRNSENDPRSGTRAGRPNSQGLLRQSDLYDGEVMNTGATEQTIMTTIPDEENVLSNNTTQPAWRSNYKPDNKEALTVTTSDLVSWAFQVARGMDYLQSRKFLHGDLAARNILLCEDNVVKICDFGLARSMYRNSTYTKRGAGPLPIKWLALESLQDQVFNTETDIWSFGIVLWEFFSLAKVPYPGMENQSLLQQLSDGYRMEKPPYANDELYDIMLECWSTNPKRRPAFNVLEKKFAQMLSDEVTSHYLDLNEPYMRINTEYQRNNKTDYLSLMGSPEEEAPPPPRYGNGHTVPEIHFSDIAPKEPHRSNSPTLANNLDSPVNKNRKKIGMEPTPEEIPMLHKTHLSDSEGERDSPDQKRKFAPSRKQKTAPSPPTRNMAETQLNSINADNYVNVKSPRNGWPVDAVSNPSYQPLSKDSPKQDETK